MAQKFNFHMPHLRYMEFDELNIWQSGRFSNFVKNCVILATVSFWPLLIIELVARMVPARNYLLNRAADMWQMEFSSPPSINIMGRRMKFIIMQLIDISTLMKNNLLKIGL